MWYQLCRLPSAVVVIDCCGDKQCAAPFSRDTSLYILSLLTTIMVVHDVGVQQCAAPSNSPGCNKMPYVPHVIDRSWQGPTIHACATTGGQSDPQKHTLAVGLKSLSILQPTNHGKVPLPHCRLAVSKAHLLSTQSLPLQHQPQLPAQHRPQGAGGTESSVNKLSLTLTLAITRYDSKSRAWPHAPACHTKKHVKCRMHGNSVSPIHHGTKV